MPQSPIATAADYADAMIVARRAKNWLFALLLIILLGQLGIFFAARYWSALSPVNGASTASAAKAFDFVRYIVGIVDFLGIALSIVFSLLLVVLLMIMLIGRLIGVARVTSALIWSLILIVLLFPWQSFLISPSLATPVATQGIMATNYQTTVVRTPTTAATEPVSALIVPGSPGLSSLPTSVATTTKPSQAAEPLPPQTAFKVPGVLYTWNELMHPTVGARFGLNPAYPETWTAKVLRWARYVAFPVIAILILLAVEIKSGRGLRLALGEADVDSGAAANP